MVNGDYSESVYFDTECMRLSDAGLAINFSAGRIGRGQKFPPQLGQIALKN